MELRCEDALSSGSALVSATRVFCNNRSSDTSEWPADMMERLVAHVVKHAPKLAAFASTAALPTASLEEAGWCLLRGTAVGVSWSAVSALTTQHSQRTVPYHTTPGHTTPRHTTPRHIAPDRTRPHRTVPPEITFLHTAPGCSVLQHATPRYTTLRHPIHTHPNAITPAHTRGGA